MYSFIQSKFKPNKPNNRFFVKKRCCIDISSVAICHAVRHSRDQTLVSIKSFGCLVTRYWRLLIRIVLIVHQVIFDVKKIWLIGRRFFFLNWSNWQKNVFAQAMGSLTACSCAIIKAQKNHKENSIIIRIWTIVWARKDRCPAYFCCEAAIQYKHTYPIKIHTIKITLTLLITLNFENVPNARGLSSNLTPDVPSMRSNI